MKYMYLGGFISIVFVTQTLAIDYPIPAYNGTGPRNVYYLTGVGDNLFNDKVIEGNNQDDWSKPYKDLRDAYVNKGYRFFTSLPKKIDDDFHNNTYVIFRHNMVRVKERQQLGSAIDKVIIIVTEPPFVYPSNFQHAFTRYMNRILTWNDAQVDNKKFFKYYFVISNLTMIDDIVPYHQKKLCTLISGNLNYKHPHELYSERRAAINFFEKYAPQDFDLYGHRWDPKKYKTFRGRTKSRTGAYKKHKFAICYENLDKHKGILTDKIFGVFIAGCVPIYLGATDVYDYIPEGCFIDRRKFTNYHELYNYISTMPEEEYNQYLQNIKAYLSSEDVRVFTIDHFIDTVARLAEFKPPKILRSWDIDFGDQYFFDAIED